MRLIEIDPNCFVNLETIVMIQKETDENGTRIVITTVTGDELELNLNFEEFMESIKRD